jgi:hypothetical protein
MTILHVVHQIFIITMIITMEVVIVSTMVYQIMLMVPTMQQ